MRVASLNKVMNKMRKFKSLNAAGLPDSFTVKKYGDEPIVEVKESKGCIAIKYIFPGFYLSDDELKVEEKDISFKQVKVEKAGYLVEKGRPLLPSFGRYVQIPFACNHECDYNRDIKKGKPVRFKHILVSPAQEELELKNASETKFDYDKNFYDKTDELYPRKIVEVSGPFEIDGYNALLVSVRPIQYNPSKKMLICHGNIDITIKVSQIEGEISEYPLMEPTLDRKAFGNFFLNPRRGICERLEIRPGKMNIPYESPGPEFLIIYADIFQCQSAAEELAKWKNSRGLVTEIVSIKTVGNSVSEIKKYIRAKKRASYRLRYVLLFGDSNSITSEPIGLGDDAYITDYYYSTKVDQDTKNHYVMPWLSIGRIPVRNEEEGKTVVEKIISYEQNPPVEPEYYRRTSFVACYEDLCPPPNREDRNFVKTVEDIRDCMIKYGFEVERVYVSDYEDIKKADKLSSRDGTEFPEDVKKYMYLPDEAEKTLISAIERGQLITAYRGHGGMEELSSPNNKPPILSVKHLEKVNIAGDFPTILFIIACNTGKFDLPGSKNSLAETILKKKKGAPSLIASTRVSDTWLNDDLMKALFDAMWPGVLLPTFPVSTASYPVKYSRLGDILNYAKAYLPIRATRSAKVIKDHFEAYHVIGDPTLELWTSEPKTLRIIRAKLIKTYLYITLSDCPNGGVITIWHRGEMLKRIEPSSTQLVLSLRGIRLFPLPSREYPISVCFWAPGYRFYECKRWQ